MAKRVKPAWMLEWHECSRGACGRTYQRVKKNQKYCSGDCRVRQWLADNPRLKVPAVRLADGRLRITLEVQDPGSRPERRERVA